MKIHHLSPQEALESLHASPQGLTHREAARRLAEFGPNQVEQIRGKPLWRRFLAEFTHFFALILWLAAALAFLAEGMEPGGGMATLGWTVMGVIGVNGCFSFWQEYRAGKALAALERLLPSQVTVARQGGVHQLPTSQLVPGDILLLEEGDDIPADCRLIEAFSVRVNLSTITGEPLPKARRAEPCQEEEILTAKNVLLAGTSMVSGRGRAVAFATGSRTEFGRIARLSQQAEQPPSPLQKEIAWLSRMVALLATGLGLLFFFIGQLVGLTFWENFLFAIGIIVANVPEGLLPTVTLSLAMATQRMAARNALVRHLPVVEALGAATVIVTDKTGTLTQNKMAAHTLELGDGLLEAGQATPALGQAAPAFFRALALCHTLKKLEGPQGPHWSGDPMELALFRLAQQARPDEDAALRLGEIPFDHDRRRMSVAVQDMGGQRWLAVKGAPESVLPLCRHQLRQGQAGPLTPQALEGWKRSQGAMADRGLRVLAVARRPLPDGPPASGARQDGAKPNEGTAGQTEWDVALENELELLGLVGLEDPPRPEVAQAMDQCHRAGIRVVMCTGDHPHTALAIARETRMIHGREPVVITGDRLKRLTHTQLELALDAPEVIFARVSASQKLRIVAALQHKGETVAVTGDGVNDAPALRKADIGIAMGLSGTDVAKEAADMILLDDNFASIVAAVEEGRAVYDNIRRFITYIATSNIPEIVPYLAFVLTRIPLPLTIIQILAVDLGTDMVPALGLGAEKPHPDTLNRPPRPRGQRLVDGPLLLRAYLFLGAMEAAAAMAAFFFVLKSGGWRYGQPLGAADPLYLGATAATLAAIIAMQAANVFLCRHERLSLAQTGLGGNRLIWWGLAVEWGLLLALLYTPAGNRLFGVSPLASEVWWFIAPLPLAMLMAEEGRKWAVRAFFKRPG